MFSIAKLMKDVKIPGKIVQSSYPYGCYKTSTSFFLDYAVTA